MGFKLLSSTNGNSSHHNYYRGRKFSRGNAIVRKETKNALPNSDTNHHQDHLSWNADEEIECTNIKRRVHLAPRVDEYIVRNKRKVRIEGKILQYS